MTFRHLFIFFLITISFSSCTYFSQTIDTLALANQGQNNNLEMSKVNFCSEKTKYQFLTEDAPTKKFYRALEDKIFQKNYPFIQKGIMMALIELIRRPDLISPSSRLQIYLKQGGKIHYFDFRPVNLEDDTKHSFIKGLEYLAKNFLGQKNLQPISNLLDTIIPLQILVSQQFESFLKQHKNELQKNELMTAQFFKGDETITRYETFTRMSFKNITNYYSIAQSPFSESYEWSKNPLVTTTSKLGVAIKCNTALESESSFSDEILSSENKKTNTMGIIEGENIFLLVSSGILQKPLKFENNFYFMKMRPNPFPSPLCEFSDQQKKLVLFSAKGRSPGQHLKHLISYEIEQINNPVALNELLKFSRHLFLPDPDRILYESKKGRKAQLDFFLSMNFPIYHVESLGEVFGSISYTEAQQQKISLIIDERNTTGLTCQK